MFPDGHELEARFTYDGKERVAKLLRITLDRYGYLFTCPKCGGEVCVNGADRHRFYTVGGKLTATPAVRCHQDDCDWSVTMAAGVAVDTP